jgi:hypothetical protein
MIHSSPGTPLEVGSWVCICKRLAQAIQALKLIVGRFFSLITCSPVADRHQKRSQIKIFAHVFAAKHMMLSQKTQHKHSFFRLVPFFTFCGHSSATQAGSQI